MKKLFLFCMAATMAATFCGCKTQIVTVDVIPSDARIIANGVEYNNRSPIFIEANSGKQLTITAYKDGYRDKMHVVDYHLSSLGKVEAWTCILVLPAIGLFFDNAWELKENNVTMVLEPVSPAAVEEFKASAPLVYEQIKNSNAAPVVTPADATINQKMADKTTNPDAIRIFGEL